MASANPHESGGLGQLPSDESGSFYPDPEGLLSVCAACAPYMHTCIHAAPQYIWPRELTTTDFLNHPEWPITNPQTTHQDFPSYGHPIEAQRPQLSLNQNEYLQSGEQSNNGDLIGGMLSSTYHAGDRLSPTRSHTRKRHSPKPRGYSCGSCSQAFDRECDLKRHTKVHLNNEERPIRCPHCGQGFLYPKDLRRHQNKHTPSERVYFCPVEGCKSAKNGFSRKDNYRRHMRSKHSQSTITTAASVSGASTN